MARFMASAGIRKIQIVSDKKEQYPFLVLIGPSGQAGQIHGPSGATSKVPLNGFSFQAYGQSYNHRALAYGRKEILYCLRNAESATNSELCYSYMMYAKNEHIKTNSAGFNPENNLDFTNLVVRDGFNHKMICGKITDLGFAYWSFLKIPGGAIHWTFPRRTNNPTEGYFTWQEEKFSPGASSGWRLLPGALGLSSDSDTSFQVGHGGNAGTPDVVNGINTARSIVGTAINATACDMIWHKGIIYEAYQYRVIARMPGTRGGYIFHDYISDTDIQNATYTATYTTRATVAQFGGASKSLSIHGDDVYMLDNNGKVFLVRPGGIRQIADLTSLGTPWSSGIAGGPSTGTAFTGNTFRRCFMASFNNQLNVFLNYNSSYRVAKGTEGSSTNGKGVFWGTSHDGINWQDRTDMLPGSGILPASGTLFNWLNDISPYRFSGKTHYNRSLYTPFQAEASGFGRRIQASGFTQHRFIPYIVSSGTLIDPSGTPFNALQIPLKRGGVSGYLGPTFVTKPARYHSVSGIFMPSGVSASGYDYTGCHNWHISGFTDEDDNKLKVLFSEDFQGIATNGNGSSLLYELNTSSGWRRVTYWPKSNQLNGLIPIDLYDPEIIIPSGDVYNPNPRVDEINQVVDMDYKIYAWPFFGLVGTKLEYTLDGRTWFHAAGHRNVNTGNIGSDPSGTIGVTQTFHWHYTDQLSKNEFYPYLQLRVRATEE